MWSLCVHVILVVVTCCYQKIHTCVCTIYCMYRRDYFTGPKDLDSVVCVVCMCVNISACVFCSSWFHAPQSVLAGPLIGSR